MLPLVLNNAATPLPIAPGDMSDGIVTPKEDAMKRQHTLEPAQRREPARIASGFALLALTLIAFWQPVLAAGAASGASIEQRSERDRQLDVESFDWIWATIRDKHYDPELGGLDWAAVRDSLRPQVEGAKTRSEARAAMLRMISLLGQSHFQIIPAPVLKAMGERPGPGSPGGTTGMDVRVVGGRALVTAVEPGSPADLLGVRPGWEILRVKDEDLAPPLREVAEASQDRTWLDLDLASVVLSRIEGRVGERGVVRFLDGQRREVDLELWLVEKKGWLAQMGPVPNIRVSFESRLLPGDVGYIRFNLFLDPIRLMPAYEAAIRSFETARGIVIDLRGNEGGAIPIAMGMTGWLVTEKDLYLGTFRFRDAELKAIVNARLEPYQGPLAVLVDGLSASCAEALSGGLQDLGRARLFGSRTAGMVLMSAIERLPNGDAFQYVFASYRSAQGRFLEGNGVIPDVQVAPSRETLLRGEDAALEAALNWIRAQKHPQAPDGHPASSQTPPAATGR